MPGRPVTARPRRAPVRPTWLRHGRRADHALFRRLTSRPAPAADAVLYPLSRAADHSKLWVGCAAVLALSGDRFARRAATRGLLAIGLTSAVTNALIKPLFRRVRPTSEPAPWLVRTARMPGSTSFPSGHAASAAAFAVGAGMELPAVAAPLGLLAAAVGASRVRTRVHYPADVVAGAAVGAAIALGTRRLWAVAPHHPAEVRPVLTRLERRPGSDGSGLTVVVNPSAGSSAAGETAAAVRDALPGARILEVGPALDLGDALDQAQTARAIGIVGGDGSINAAAERALRAGVPLAVFPGGTLNHFARDVGLSDMAETVAAVRAGELVSVDVGMIDGRPFLNTASFGSYAELVDAREELEPSYGKWGAMVVAAFRLLRSAKPIRVEMDGRPADVWMIFIGNCEYEPAGLAPGWRARLDDGKFDVRYVAGDQPGSRTRLVLALVTGQLARSPTYRRLVVDRLAVRSQDGPLRLARDGETFDGSTAVLVTKHPEPLAVFAPWSDAETAEPGPAGR